MQINASLVSLLFSGASSRSSDTLLSIVQSRVNGTASAAQRDPIVVLKDAEKNGAKQIAAKAKEPQVKREIDDFIKGVLKASTLDELLADPRAMKVLLTANGLEEFATYKGLVAKALKSDPADAKSLAVQLSSTNVAWLDTVKTYKFATSGLAVLKESTTLAAVSLGYAEVRWRESLDASAPGVSAALTFKDKAKTLTSAYLILGSAVAREVVTGALGLPAQLAYQPLESQATAVTRRLDIKKLQDPAFVDTLVKRYLINLNYSGGGITT